MESLPHGDAEQRDWKVTAPRTIDLDGVRELVVDSTAGRIDVLGRADDISRIEVVEVRGDPLAVELRDGILTLTHRTSAARFLDRLLTGGQVPPGKAKERCVASVAVPARTRVTVRTAVGETLVAGIDAEVSARTVTGPLLVDGTSGRLSVHTVSGEAIVRGHRGRLAAESVSGDITASGDLSDVIAESVSGSIHLDLHGRPETVSATTVSGAVRIRVPEGVGIQLAARTASGSVALNEQSFRGIGTDVRVSEGPEEPSVAIRTEGVSGRVAVFHAAPSETSGAGR